MREYRRIDYLLDELAGHRPGAYDFQGAKVLVTKAPRIIEPVEGDFSTIQQLVVSLLPNDLRDDRFGVRPYENPSIRASLQEERPEVQLMDMIDVLKPWLKSTADHWQGKAVELQSLLEDDPETSSEFARWMKHNSLSRNLGRLAAGDVEALKDRIVHDRDNKH